MTRGRPSKGSTGGEGNKRGRGRPPGGNKNKKDEEKAVVEVDDDGSDNEREEEEDVEGGELPVAPASVKSVKKVVIAPKEISSLGWGNVQELYLKHPRTNNKSLFLLCTKKADDSSESFQMFEMLTMQQETRSWFVNNTVISDGNLYVCTPMDPLFFVIQILAQSTKTKPIADHFSDSSLPPLVVDLFSKRITHKQLENVSIKKECDDIVAFAYSEEKTLAWLSAKTEKVSKYLAEKRISLTESSVSSNFVKSSAESISDEDGLRYACDIVGEYIDDSLKRKLLEKFNLPVLTEKSGLKRKNDQGEDETENEGSNKKTKVSDEDNMPLEDYGSKANGTPAKATKITAKEKVLQKAAQGSHSLLKFFAAKPK